MLKKQNNLTAPPLQERYPDPIASLKKIIKDSFEYMPKAEELSLKLIDLSIRQAELKLIGEFVRWMRIENDVSIVYKKDWEKFIESLKIRNK